MGVSKRMWIEISALGEVVAGPHSRRFAVSLNGCCALRFRSRGLRSVIAVPGVHLSNCAEYSAAKTISDALTCIIVTDDTGVRGRVP